MNQNTYLLLRLALGASMFGHGLVRLPKLNAFSHWMVESFKNSFLPKVVVVPFSYLLPIAEFGVGLLLIIGLFTQQSLIAGAMVMLLLIFGTTLIENWESLPSQLIHVAFFTILLQFISSNSIALDMLLNKK
ncbi:DoxX family protein [Cloacibacterium sp.]|jgi:thiosulfate dehydrogenase [quinone] large subunit|uniref:DoxX family protein n=1 Tax=Cloacibacterium sp. TaxID=1913682 RepID=UPI0035B1EEBC